MHLNKSRKLIPNTRVSELCRAGISLSPFLWALISFCSHKIQVGQKAMGNSSKEEPEVNPLSFKGSVSHVVEISPLVLFLCVYYS